MSKKRGPSLKNADFGLGPHFDTLLNNLIKTDGWISNTYATFRRRGSLKKKLEILWFLKISIFL